MIDLTEGLQRHDLDHLVMPLLSIDEYCSKIDDRKAIVVGFYVTDSDPAGDLAHFIKKSTIQSLDIDVSPAPTEDGYYIVFVELDRDESFPKKLLALVESLDNICDVTKWQFSPYGNEGDDNYDLTLEALTEHINLDPESIEVGDDDDIDITDAEIAPDENTAEEIKEWLQNSLVGSVLFDDIADTLTLKDGRNVAKFKILEFSNTVPSIPFSIPQIGNKQLSESARLQSMLGQQYWVYSTSTNGNIIVSNDDAYMVLKPLD
jgi:hypothetical protein